MDVVSSVPSDIGGQQGPMIVVDLLLGVSWMLPRTSALAEGQGECFAQLRILLLQPPDALGR